MDQAYRDSHGNTDEEQICPYANGHETLLVPELVVEPICDRTSQPKGESHTGRSNAERYPPIPHEEAQVHLESHEEEEEDQTDVGRR